MNISRTIVPLRAFFVKHKKRADIAFLGETFVVCKKQEYLFFLPFFLSPVYTTGKYRSQMFSHF